MRRLAFTVALTALAGACGDAPRDPVALLVAPEARAALEVGSTLPSLPEVLHRSIPAGVVSMDLLQAEALWQEASATADARQATELRESAYALAAPALAARMDSTTLATTQARLDRWIALASGVLRQADLRDLSAAMTEAQQDLDAARSAEARHDRTAAIVATLRASDRLSETTPPAVATRLTVQDEAALDGLRHVTGRPTGEDERRRLERIDRLVRGAREALAAGRYELAIRRAYYARQLLGAEGALAGG